MQQYGSNGHPYDQSRDPLRFSSAPTGQGGRPDNGCGFNGEPLSRPPARAANGTVRRTRTDNSIEFPTQAPASGAQRPRRSPQSTRTASRPQGSRPSQHRGGQSTRQPRQAQRPSQGRRPASGSGQRYNKDQRLRPAPGQDLQRREVRKKRRLTRAAVRRRRILRRLTAFALLLCVIGAGMYLTMTMLFRIHTIQVQTADGTPVQTIAGYSADSILQALGVQVEDNIFSFEPGAKAAALEQQFPLLESIRVVRDYPNTVVVQVTQAVPAYAMEAGGSWLTLSEQFKILESSPTQPQGLCTLWGGEVASATPGQQLAFAARQSDSGSASEQDTTQSPLEALGTLQTKLEEYGLLDQVTRLEFAETEQIAFLYQDRISVLLGTLNDLDYKLDRARYMLNNEDGKGCAATDTGRLDFSHVSAGSTRKIYFAQGEPTLPSGYVVPPAPEPDPAETPAQDTEAAETTETTETTETAGEAAEAAPDQAAPADPQAGTPA